MHKRYIKSSSLFVAPTILALSLTLPVRAERFLADQSSSQIQPPTAIVRDPMTVYSSSTSSTTSTTEKQSVTAPLAVNKTVTTSTTTVEHSDSTTELRPSVTPQEVTLSSTVIEKNKKRERSDFRSACKMAKYHWLDKAVEADPSLVESICNHYTAARILAKHPRLGEIAKYDHYTCRRLTKWKSVARIMAKNGECEKVIAYDPEGIYLAIKRDRRLAKLISKNPMFDQMISENPDLGRLISLYM